MFTFIKDYIKMYTRLFAILYILLFIGACYLFIVYVPMKSMVYLLFLIVLSIISKIIEWFYMSMRAVVKYRKLPKSVADVQELNLTLRQYIVYVVTLATVKVTNVNYILWALSAPLCLILVFLDCITGVLSDEYMDLYTSMHRPWYVCQNNSSPFTKALEYAGQAYGHCPKRVSTLLIDDVYHGKDLTERLTKGVYDQYIVSTEEVSDE